MGEVKEEEDPELLKRFKRIVYLNMEESRLTDEKTYTLLLKELKQTYYKGSPDEKSQLLKDLEFPTGDINE